MKEENVAFNRKTLLGPAVLVIFIAAAFASYLNALSGPFFLDDGDHIGDNQLIRITSLSPKALYDAAFLGPSPNRPVPKLTFALDYFRAGLSTRQFRLTNITLHALAAFAAWIYLCLVLGHPGPDPSYRQRGRAIAFCAALLWMLSPVQTQSVSYIVQRMNILAALFYFSSFAAYILARRSSNKPAKTAWFVLCGLCAVLAAGSKENAAMLPFFLFLYEWFFFQDLDIKWLRSKGIVFLLLCAAFVLAVGLAAMGPSPMQTLAGPYQVRHFSMAERLLTQSRVVCHYISLLLLPLPGRLNLDHDFPLSTGLFSPAATFFSIAFIFAALASSAVLAKKHRLLAFSILWFFGNLVIESSVIGLEMVFEHRLYLPSLFFFLMIAILVFRLVKIPKLAMAVCLALAVASGIGTRVRNEAWAGELAMWQDAVKKSPKKARPRYSLAIALYREGRLDEAAQEARKAVNLDPADTDAWFNLGRVLEHPDINNLKDALAAYREAIRLGPRDFMPLVNCSFVLARLGRFDEAFKALAPAMAQPGDDPLVSLTAGRILLYEKKPDQALNHLKKALALAPDMALVHENIGTALAQLHLFREASESFQKAARLDPENKSALCNLGHSLYRQGLYRQARDAYSRAASLDENDVETLMTLAVMENLTGRPSEAISTYMRAAAAKPGTALSRAAEKRANRLRARFEAARAAAADLEERLKANPKNPAALMELGVSLERMGDYKGAERAYVAVEKLVPGAGGVKNNLGLVAMRRENYAGARVYFEKALEINGKSQAAIYNMMCLFSRINEREKAVEWLKRLLGTGFSDYSLISSDTDLENLRETGYYLSLVKSGRGADPASAGESP